LLLLAGGPLRARTVTVRAGPGRLARASVDRWSLGRGLLVAGAVAGALLGSDPADSGADLWLQWGCPLAGCDHWVVLPWELGQHAAAEHPGWTATFHAEEMRVVYRRAAGQGSGEG